MQFIDSVRFKASSLSNLVNNLYEGIDRIKCKYKQIFNTYKFSNQDNIKFILFLQKAVYPYEYIDDWKKFSETSLPEKQDFYSYLNMEDIIDAD